MSTRTNTRRQAAAAVAPPPPAQARRGAAGEDERFDRLIYGRVRLGIMSALAVNEQLSFNDLKALFAVTDGNLGAHARKLEDAGYIACRKTFEERRPRTEYRLTGTGRKALERYLQHIEAVIRATRRA
jgi:DNA-binding HxlR family transcriptional regulator